MKNAKIDYLNRNYESACRKYEEVSTPNLFDNLVGVQYLEILQFYKYILIDFLDLIFILSCLS